MQAEIWGEVRSYLSTLQQQNYREEGHYPGASLRVLETLLRTVPDKEERQVVRDYVRSQLGPYYLYAPNFSDLKGVHTIANAINLHRNRLKSFGECRESLDWVACYATATFDFLKRYGLPAHLSESEVALAHRYKGLQIQGLRNHSPDDVICYVQIPPTDILFMQNSRLPANLERWLRRVAPKVFLATNCAWGARVSDEDTCPFDILALETPHKWEGTRVNTSLIYRPAHTSTVYRWDFRFVSRDDLAGTRRKIPEAEMFEIVKGDHHAVFHQVREKYFPWAYRHNGESSQVQSWRHALHLV